jgi:hypothetical protein
VVICVAGRYSFLRVESARRRGLGLRHRPCHVRRRDGPVMSRHSGAHVARQVRRTTTTEASGARLRLLPHAPSSWPPTSRASSRRRPACSAGSRNAGTPPCARRDADYCASPHVAHAPNITLFPVASPSHPQRPEWFVPVVHARCCIPTTWRRRRTTRRPSQVYAASTCIHVGAHFTATRSAVGR